MQKKCLSLVILFLFFLWLPSALATIDYADITDRDDIPEWAEEPVQKLINQDGVVTRTHDTFGPDDIVSRGELSYWIAKGAGFNRNTSGGPHFPDVPEDNEYYDEIETLYNQKLISPNSSSLFKPAVAVTRGEIAQIVFRAFEFNHNDFEDNTAGAPHFKDVEENDWYYEAVETVYNKGIMDAAENEQFNPDGSVTRAEIAAIIYESQLVKRADDLNLRTAECSDTDEGRDFYKQGTVNSENENVVYVDECQIENDKSYVLERFCNADGNLQTEKFLCPKGCYEGQCSESQHFVNPPDLVVEEIFIGQDQKIRMTYCNTGNAFQAPNARLVHRLTMNDITLQRHENGISMDEKECLDVVFDYPKAFGITNEGTYGFQAETDSLNELSESIESNNEASMDITLKPSGEPPLADLRVGEINLELNDLSPFADDFAVYFEVMVENEGTESVNQDFYVYLTVPRGYNYPVSGWAKGQYFTENLAPDESQSVKVGTYLVDRDFSFLELETKVCVDQDDGTDEHAYQIPESNEKNNCYTQSLQYNLEEETPETVDGENVSYTERPDFRIEIFEYKELNNNFRLQVCNRGMDDWDSNEDVASLWLALKHDDISEKKPLSIGALEADKCYDGVISIPKIFPGNTNINIQAIIDPDNHIFETIEDNNTKTISITLPDYAALLEENDEPDEEEITDTARECEKSFTGFVFDTDKSDCVQETVYACENPFEYESYGRCKVMEGNTYIPQKPAPTVYNKSLAAEDFFPDTDSTSIEGEAAAFLRKNKIIEGRPDGNFHGNDPVNRAELAKFLLLGKKTEIGNIQNNGRFPDVEIGSWYEKFVMKTENMGIINGYPDGTYQPGKNVNTAEFLKMMSKTFGLEENLPYGYEDFPADHWYSIYAGTAQKYQMFPHRDPKTLQANKDMTRNEVAVALYQYLRDQ